MWHSELVCESTFGESNRVGMKPNIGPLRICLIGGIFGKPKDYQRRVAATPETTLLQGLRELGHEVEPHGHYGVFDIASFDVIHVHHLSRGAVAVAKRHGSVPLVFTPHESIPPAGLRRLAMRYAMNRADAIVALSQTELSSLKRQFKAGPSRHHVIPNGIDGSAFPYSPPRRPALGQPWRLLYVGQLIRQKGVHDLLAALATLDIEVGVQLDIAYHVATEARILRRLSRELGLSVNFLGPRVASELAELYAACHVFVFPSYYREALPSVITEALLSGRPVVATRVGAVEEQLAGFGQCVPPREPSAFAAALSRVLDRYDDYVAQAQKVSQTTRSRYSIESMLAKHESLYLSLQKPSSLS
jgi:glycosyltransferase involved in cell wall biosynthesis